jgi:hypothetical protein
VRYLDVVEHPADDHRLVTQSNWKASPNLETERHEGFGRLDADSTRQRRM